MAVLSLRDVAKFNYRIFYALTECRPDVRTDIIRDENFEKILEYFRRKKKKRKILLFYYFSFVTRRLSIFIFIVD